MRIPRILLAAGASGSGKTLITCGLLQALVNRNLTVASFKCGPDYIDPMFHSRVIGAKSANLDTFFTSPEVTRYLLSENAANCEIAVMEGVMGYYDGVAGTTTQASAYDLASVTDTPVILIVNSKGMSVSLAAYIKGFAEYRKDSHIKGVILNQMSPMLYPRMKELLEKETGLSVLGYVPKVEDCVIESRHLGLVLPDEIPQLRERLQKLAKILEDTLEIDEILKLAADASEVQAAEPRISFHLQKKVRIGVAEDEAFCFYYKDNFRLLKSMGAELVTFSPMRDEHLPENLKGLILGGGYPELNARELEANVSMREDIRRALNDGMPCLAECGGFMYLHDEMEAMDGNSYHMAGVISGRAYRTQRLNRFGYVTLTQKKEVLGMNDMGGIPAHEFHYFDSTANGDDCVALKPVSGKKYDCVFDKNSCFVGFPHLYYPSAPQFAENFVKKAKNYADRSEVNS